MKKKEFTLVELLAVIVILGILSVLIVPKVVNTLKDSKEKTNIASVKGLLSAAQYKYQNESISGSPTNIVIDYETGQNVDKLDYSGENPEKGKVQITSDGKINMAIKIGEKCYIKIFSSEDIEIKDYNSETCKASKSFAEDSWADIKSNLMFDRDFYEIGSTKEVVIDDMSYTVRLANKSSCPNDWPTTASQTTCGVVIEFVDLIIDKDNNNADGHVMNPTDTNVGGWPVSNMRNYLNTTILNKLPNELKEMILYTSVVSGHGSTQGETNFTTKDKIYLLSFAEVWGRNSSRDSVKLVDNNVTDGTKALEYYNMQGRTVFKETIGGTRASWWLRSADFENTSKFVFVFHLDSTPGIADATWVYGVAPAFRILD